MREKAYKPRMLIAFSFRQSTLNRREPYFLRAKAVRAVNLVGAVSITFSVIIGPTFAAANVRVVGLARYGPEYTGRTSSLGSCIQCFATLVRRGYPSHMHSNSPSISKKAGRWSSNLADSCVSSLEMLFTIASSFSFINSCLAI